MRRLPRGQWQPFQLFLLRRAAMVVSSGQNRGLRPRAAPRAVAALATPLLDRSRLSIADHRHEARSNTPGHRTLHHADAAVATPLADVRLAAARAHLLSALGALARRLRVMDAAMRSARHAAHAITTRQRKRGPCCARDRRGNGEFDSTRSPARRGLGGSVPEPQSELQSASAGGSVLCTAGSNSGSQAQKPSFQHAA